MFELPSEERKGRGTLRVTRERVEQVLDLPSLPISAAG